MSNQQGAFDGDLDEDRPPPRWTAAPQPPPLAGPAAPAAAAVKKRGSIFGTLLTPRRPHPGEEAERRPYRQRQPPMSTGVTPLSFGGRGAAVMVVDEKLPKRKRNPFVVAAVVALVIVLAVVAGVLGWKLSPSGQGNSSGSGGGPTPVSQGQPTSFPVPPSQGTPFPNTTVKSNSVCHGRVCPSVLAVAQFVKPPTAFIFGRGEDRAIWYRTTDDDKWTSEWRSLGGDMSSQPGAASGYDGRIEVVARASNDTIQVKSYLAGTWNETWSVIGLKSTSPPSVSACRRGDIALEIVARGTTGEIQRQSWRHGAYAGGFSPVYSWEAHGGVSASTPAYAGCEPYQIAVFGYSGADHPLFVKAWSASWGSWYQVGGNFRADPVIASRTELESITFGVAINGTLQYYNWTREAASAPPKLDNLGGAFQTVPNVLVTSTDRLDVLIVGTDDRLKHRALIGSKWAPGWQDLGGAFNSTPLAVRLVPNKVTVYGLSDNGSLLHSTWTTTDSEYDWEGKDNWLRTEGPPLALEYY